MVRDAYFHLTDQDVTPLPVQSEITARWPDGSVKWSRHIVRAKQLGDDGELTAGAETPAQDLEIMEV